MTTVQTVELKPIAEILDAGRGEQSNSTDAASESQATPQTNNDPAGDGSADHDDVSDGQPQPKWIPAHALKKEREKRRALIARNCELEEENRAILDASYSEQPQPTGYQQPQNDFAAIEAKANYRASRAEFISEHGKDAYQALDAALGSAAQSNHPQLQIALQVAKQSDDPIGVVHEWVRMNGLLPDRQQTQQRAPLFPSNLSGVRNVGVRNGPAWSGPTSLDDIFNRKRR